jgi:glucokinase
MDQGPLRTPSQGLLLAGDIGATATRLALVSREASPQRFIAEREFPS